MTLNPSRCQRISEGAEALARRWAELCQVHGAPGGGLVVLHGGKRWAAWHGLANAATGAPVTADTCFNYGSVTKLLVATQCMQAVERGALALDIPLHAMWPELPLPGPWRDQITLAHLLRHQGGFEGDNFDDTGIGPDALARFAELCQSLPASFPPGTVHSYSNVGYALLGRLLEMVYDCPWDDTLQRTLAGPLELRSVGTPFVRGFDGGMQARGHAGSEGDWRPIDHLRLLRGNGPCGATVTGTVDDLAKFGLAHVNASRGCGGMLSPGWHAAMCKPQVTVPCPNGWSSFGLGVMHFDEAGRLAGHNGAVDGVWSHLRWVADDDLVLAFIVNGGDGPALAAAVHAAAFPALADVEPVSAAQAGAHVPPEAASRWAGHYGSDRYRVEVCAGGEPLRLQATYRPSPRARDLGDAFTVDLLQPQNMAPRGRFLVQLPHTRLPSYVAFLGAEDHPPQALNFRGRTLCRLPEPSPSLPGDPA